MKKLILVIFILSVSCNVISFASKNKVKPANFRVEKQNVYFNNNLIAFYQAKTYSLDNGELVEEYNLKYVGEITNKQLIGDLIDFISDRHQNAEVEIEIDPQNGQMNL